MVATEKSWIEKSPGCMGGEARIRRMRFAVWLLVEARELGATDDDLMEDYSYSGLTRDDLAVAWKYYEENPEEIRAAIRRNQLSDEL